MYCIYSSLLILIVKINSSYDYFVRLSFLGIYFPIFFVFFLLTTLVVFLGDYAVFAYNNLLVFILLLIIVIVIVIVIAIVIVIVIVIAIAIAKKILLYFLFIATIRSF